jgi:ABC-type glycerol-3-phosphate transport system substrate-binding protein
MLPRKIFAISIVLLLLALLLPSCADAAPTPQPGRTLVIITATPRATTPPTPTATPLVPEISPDQMAGIEVEVWYVAEPYQEDPLADLAAGFAADNPYDLAVNPVPFEHPTDLEAAVQTAMEEGNLPDVILAYPYQYNAWAEEGLPLLELAEYVASSNYGLSGEQIDEIYPVFWGHDVYNGARLGFPGLFYGHALVYNRTWAQELGFSEAPLSSQQFSRQACASADARGDGTGGWMINTQPGSAAAWLLSFTGGLESLDGYQTGLPEVSSAFTFLAGLNTDGCAWRSASLYPYQSFADRKGLFYTVSTREVTAMAAAFREAGFLDTWDLIGLPNDRGEPAISVYGRSYVILESDLPQQVAAWLLVRSLTDLESQVRLAEAAGYYPLSSSAVEPLKENGQLPRAWVNGLELLENAYFEPRWPSWGSVRGVVQDAVAEVLKPGFSEGTVSVVLDQFQQLVEELHQGD